MNNKNDWKDTARMLSKMSHVTGFGISLMTPIILLLLGAMWLQERFGLGDWIVAVAVVCGLISAGVTFYRFVSDEIKRAKKEEAEYICAREERTKKAEGRDREDET